MPSIVTEAALAPEALAAPERRGEFAPEMVPRGCRIGGYKEKKIPASFSVSGDIIAFASPDSTFAVTKRLLDGARKSILIGVYDFSADHVKTVVLAAMARGVKVELMLDVDSKVEEQLMKKLEAMGADCTAAPSCASKKRHFLFRSSHEKVIVIDNAWCIVQSGNYSDNSIPLNVLDGDASQGFVTGNRDMGLAVRSASLAKFFRKILEGDIKLELEGPEGLGAATALTDTFLVERAPTKRPGKIFPSKKFAPTSPLKVTPVLSPDNYMKVIPEFLAKARKSIIIEQQYIRASQPQVRKLLDAIKKARAATPGIQVRIILGKVFDAKDVEKERKNLGVLKDDYNLKLGTNVRYVDTSRLVHCHNKLIIVDGVNVLVSSQNWSDAAVTENREAGLLLSHKGIATYFSNIFEVDWSTAKKEFGPSGPEAVTPAEVRAGRWVRVVAADYQEV